MALVINNTPAASSSVHGPLMFTIYESVKANDNVTYPNYKYICDVYSGTTLLARLKSFPNPANKRGVFNIGPIIQNTLATAFNPVPASANAGTGTITTLTSSTSVTGTGTTFTSQVNVGDRIYSGSTMIGTVASITNNTALVLSANAAIAVTGAAFTIVPGAAPIAQTFGDGTFYKDIVLKIGEEYNYTMYTNLLIDSTRRFYNHYNFSYHENILPSFVDKWATNRPVIKALDTQRLFLPFYSSTATKSLVLTSYTASGTQQATATIALTGTADALWIFDLGKAQVNILAPGLINASTDYYTATIGAQTCRINIICEVRFTPYVLTFLNQVGGMESVVFPKVSKKTYEKQAASYARIPYTMDSGGVVSFNTANNVVNEVRSTYASQFDQKLKLTSDLLTDAEWKWLKELLLSPVVYLHDGGYLRPVLIAGTTYEEMKYVNNRLNAFQIDIDLGIKRNAQFR